MLVHSLDALQIPIMHFIISGKWFFHLEIIRLHTVLKPWKVIKLLKNVFNADTMLCLN